MLHGPEVVDRAPSAGTLPVAADEAGRGSGRRVDLLDQLRDPAPGAWCGAPAGPPAGDPVPVSWDSPARERPGQRTRGPPPRVFPPRSARRSTPRPVAAPAWRTAAAPAFP